MKLDTITFVLSACIIISVLVEVGSNDTTTTKSPTVKTTTTKITTKKSTTTTEKPTTTTKKPTTTTKKPTTTTKKPTTTTKKPTTTTKKPTTTTKKPTTTTKKPTTTTKKPTTTTKKPTTTTKKPTTKKPTTKKPTTTTKPPTTKPVTTKPPTTKPATTKPATTKPATTAKPTAPPTPSPYDLDLDVTKDGVKCLMLKGQISLKVKKEVIALSREGCQTAGGECSSMKKGNETSEIKVKCVIGSKANSVTNVNMTIMFKGGDVWYLSGIAVNVVNSNMTAHAKASYGTSANGKLFQAQRNHSYTCAKDHALQLLGKDNNVTVDFKKISIQPFAGKEYVNPVICPSGVTPSPDSSIVPIAVGCALAGLILIVLIAYLIGRRKGGSRGYQKV